ncbi:MAG: amino acid permease [Candidatus Kryptonium sp.]
MAQEVEVQKEVKFEAKLGLFDATMIVMGSMIGSGIFIAPSIMAGYMPVPQFLILLWVVGGILTAFGAIAYGELAGMMPKAGGQYVFLREAYNPLLGFLYGWTLFFVIQSGFIAAVAIAFAKYLGVFIPALSENNVIFKINILGWDYTLNSAQLVGVGVIAFLTCINCFGVVFGAFVQNLFTVSKIAAIVALVLLAFAIGNGNWSNFFESFSVENFQPIAPPEALSMGFLAAFAVAMSKALFAYDAWNSVTFAAEEVKEPHKTVPRSLVLGTIGVMLVYVLANMAYLYIVPIREMAVIPDNRVAAEVAERIFGVIGAQLIAIAIMISTFGCDNGMILAAPRVYYAMAKDGLFFKGAGKLHPKYKTPVNSLILQGVWSSVLTLSGTYSALLTYTAFTSLLFNVLTVIGLFILRKKYPDRERPYKAWGYPIIPILYILVAVFFIIYIIVGDPKSSGLGLLLVLIGIPAYVYWMKTKNKHNS